MARDLRQGFTSDPDALLDLVEGAYDTRLDVHTDGSMQPAGCARFGMAAGAFAVFEDRLRNGHRHDTVRRMVGNTSYHADDILGSFPTKDLWASTLRVGLAPIYASLWTNTHSTIELTIVLR